MPAMSSRLYTVTTEMSLEELRSALSDVRITTEQEIYGERYELQTIIRDLHWGDPEREVLSGTLLYETLHGFPQIDGEMNYIRAVNNALFSFFYGEITLYLVPFTNKYKAEKTAQKMDYIITHGEDEPHPMVFNQRVPTRAIEDFLRTHPHIIKHCGWAGLDFIGVNKSSLGGANVMQFDHSQDYDEHGRKSFVLFELLDSRRWVIRISEEGIITFYSSIRRDEALNFIREEIIPLLT